MNEPKVLEVALELNFSKKLLTDADVQILADFFKSDGRSCPLRSLNLSHNKLSTNAMPGILALIQALPELAELDVSNNKLKGSKCIKALHPVIIAHNRLAILKIGGNDLGPNGVTLLGNLFQAAPNLISVDLGWKSFTKSAATGQILSVDSDQQKHGKAHLGGNRFMSMLSRHVVLSPDKTLARKMTGGDQFNANIQWEVTTPPDESGCLSYTYKLFELKHWVAVGWAPDCILPDVKQYNKYGCYLTSTGFACGPAGTPSATLNVEERGAATVIRTRYDPTSHVITWHEVDGSRPGQVLAEFHDVSIFPALYPTICFGHEGAQVSLVGSIFQVRDRTASEISGTLSSHLSRMSQASTSSVNEPDFHHGPSSSSSFK